MSKIENIKTFCCESTWTRKSRAVFICDKCKKDVTIDIILLLNCIENE